MSEEGGSAEPSFVGGDPACPPVLELPGIVSTAFYGSVSHSLLRQRRFTTWSWTHRWQYFARLFSKYSLFSGVLVSLARQLASCRSIVFQEDDDNYLAVEVGGAVWTINPSSLYKYVCSILSTHSNEGTGSVMWPPAPTTLGFLRRTSVGFCGRFSSYSPRCQVGIPSPRLETRKLFRKTPARRKKVWLWSFCVRILACLRNLGLGAEAGSLAIH